MQCPRNGPDRPGTVNFVTLHAGFAERAWSLGVRMRALPDLEHLLQRLCGAAADFIVGQ